MLFPSGHLEGTCTRLLLCGALGPAPRWAAFRPGPALSCRQAGIFLHHAFLRALTPHPAPRRIRWVSAASATGAAPRPHAAPFPSPD